MKNSHKSVLVTENYRIDPVHSTISFKAKHMTINHILGRFNEFEGEINFDPHDLANSSIWISIQITSIDTYNKDRDEHLRGIDFFDIIHHPAIAFNSHSISKQESKYTVNGDLSIKGVSKRISFPAHIEGPVKNAHGQQVIGIIGEMTINRKDFGISFDKTVDDGKKPMVDDHVKVDINIEALK